MLKLKYLDSWEDFERASKQEIIEEVTYDVPRHTIFRGHSDAAWPLHTTLERMIGENMLVENYFNLIGRVKTKIETFTNQKWELPTFEEFKNTIEYPSRMDDQTYIYMTYLRHFGFPSPLLDWTQSPYVAAYFAFKDVSSSADSVAIYMYSVLYDDHFMHLLDESYIFPIVRSPRNNKRHELQQGVYSICLREENGRIYFSKHEDAGVNPDDEMRLPAVTKFILPASERGNALRALQIYNINSYSLFGTEESLLESLFLERYVVASLSKAHIEKRAREYPGHDNIDIKDINNIW